MLYTGGTTGMPKGVMYAMGGATNGFAPAAASPLLQALAATDVAELGRRGAPVVDGRAAVGERSPACPLMHGTGLWLAAR